MLRTDLGVHAAVSAAVRAALGVQAAQVNVAVRDGVVTLTGVVDRSEEKLTAERVVQAVPGVHAVAEELEVRNAHTGVVTDEALAHAALDALAHGAFPIGLEVTIRVKQGWLALGGTVESPAEYSAIERALGSLPGLQGMTSQVRVVDTGQCPTACAVSPQGV